MRIRIPRAVMRCGRSKYYTYYTADGWHIPFEPSPPREKYQVIMGCALNEDTEFMEMESYFWNTHHRPMNDVVHSKTVADGEAALRPNAFDSNGRLFPDHKESYGGGSYYHSSIEDVILSGDVAIRSLPSCIIRNKGQECWYVRFDASNDMPWSDSKFWCRFYIQYYCAVYGDKRYVYGCYYEPQIQMQGTRSRIGSSQWYTYNWAPTGRIIRVDGGPPLPDEVYDVLGSLVSGFTAYSINYSRQYLDKSASGIQNSILSYLDTLVSNWGEEGRKTKYAQWQKYNYKADTVLDYPELVPYAKRFLLHEDFIVAEGGDPLISGNKNQSNFWRNWLIQSAYLDALGHTPKLNDNSISNILEIAGFMKALLIDHRIDIPKRLGDVWLSYRYTYGTTKMDAEEAIDFMHRHCELGTLDQWIHCFGSASHLYQGEEFTALITCRCGLEIRPRDIAILDKAWRALYTYGLQPNFYVVWDMIPYSFIVDWFIPIGNLLHAWDAEAMYNGTYYEIKDVVFSLSYNIVDEYRNEYHQYTRWATDGVPQLNGFYQLIEDPASTKVVGMRILDAASLFIGKVKR